MERARVLRRATGLVLVSALLSVVAPLWFPAPAGATAGATASVPVGTITANGLGLGYPYGITTGPDGNLWFANYYASSIGRITPAPGLLPVSSCEAS